MVLAQHGEASGLVPEGLHESGLCKRRKRIADGTITDVYQRSDLANTQLSASFDE